ncbi:MAG: cytochrome C [bacterium]
MDFLNLTVNTIVSLRHELMKRKLLSYIYFFCLIAQTARAQISPGELAQSHADLESMTKCMKCHTLGGGPNANKCLECHLEIKQSIDNKTGYHFLVTAKDINRCFKCHSDHNGRNFNLIHWPNGKENFDHDMAGFPLEGKHSEKECEACHKPKNIVHDPRKLNEKIDIQKTLLGLDKACWSCHPDEHQGQLSKDCLQCHNYSRWKPADKFSHDKAKFRLTGKHQNVECAKCHPRIPMPSWISTNGRKLFFTKFVGLQFANCTACHRDVHLGKLGENCHKCHDTFGWYRINSGDFDHSLTRFPLIGLHKKVACDKCHIGDKMKTSMRFANCTDCHRDIHFGQFVDRKDRGRCESCHNVFGFLPANYDIQEHAESRYPLTGAHLAVPCVVCHFVADRGTSRERRIFEFKDTTCQGCHDDVHKGQFARHIQLGGCTSCHQTTMWQDTKFDHNRSRFPLKGKHAEVECRKCHKLVDVGSRKERILFRPMKMACSDCHKDIHLGQFSQRGQPAKCEKCHIPVLWSTLLFDHNRDSLFRLRGAHEKVRCNQCHKLQRTGTIEFVRYKPIDRRCINCHGKM